MNNLPENPVEVKQKSRISLEFGHIADILNKTDDQTDLSELNQTDIVGTDKGPVKSSQSLSARRVALLDKSINISLKYL